MIRKFVPLIIMMFFTFALSGCIVWNESRGYGIINEGQNITNTHPYNVNDDFKGMKLKVDLKLNKGEVKIQLKDPNGEIRWEEIATKDNHIEETKEFEKIVGEWMLTFTSIDNTGDGKYNIKFNRK